MKDMKKYISYLLFVLVVFCSCEDDFLNQVPDDKLTTEAFYRDAKDAEAALASVYSYLSSTGIWNYTERVFVPENMGSDMLITGKGSSEYVEWTAMSEFTDNANNKYIASYWWYSYVGINHANQVIEKVGKMTKDQIEDDVKNQIIGEAKFLRGFYHFRLLNCFEKIVLQMSTPANEGELEKPLSERSVVWEAIEQDFKDALILPETYDNANTGRVTKGAAIAYLGKAYLFQKKYKEAEAEFKKLVVDRIGKYDLVDNFLSLFDGTNENSCESIFEIQFSSLLSNGSKMGHDMARFISSDKLGGWECVLATPKLLNLYKEEGKVSTEGKYDARLYGTLYFNDPDVDVYGKPYREVWPSGDLIFYRKFIPSDMKIELQSNKFMGINMPQMRYADVLLMYAEALNENNLTSTAKKYVDQVRARAKMPALNNSINKGDLFKVIQKERAKEFAIEGMRISDLRRYGDDVMKKELSTSGNAGQENFDISKHKFYLIPQVEVNSNGKIK
ncbi:RagB/SusD family nutrient uptake outer membrane protein [Marinilabiliaceae bacterium JC017]|nr:RagB/SusD family nutrient uptake outer membrane protein [Marinilabiliaceae bacterium JC017]